MTQDEIESIARRYKDATRDGAKALFDILYQSNVPILIFSAGLGDSVRAMLKNFNMLLPNVKVKKWIESRRFDYNIFCVPSDCRWFQIS